MNLLYQMIGTFRSIELHNKVSFPILISSLFLWDEWRGQPEQNEGNIHHESVDGQGSSVERNPMLRYTVPICQKKQLHYFFCQSGFTHMLHMPFPWTLDSTIREEQTHALLTKGLSIYILMWENLSKRCVSIDVLLNNSFSIILKHDHQYH